MSILSRRSARRVRAGLAAVAATAIALVSVPAFADGLAADGDTISAGNGVALSGNCKLPVSVTTGTVSFNWNNSDKPSHFVPGSATLSYSSTSAQVSASGNETFTVPSDYGAGNPFSKSFSTTIASGASTGSATVTITATQATYTKSTSYAVTWSCVQNSAPTVSVTGVTDGRAYEYGNVPAAGCAWDDDHDGSGTTTPKVTGPTGPRAAAGLGSVKVDCSYTDQGNLTGTATATYTIEDTTPPAIPDLVAVTAAAKNAAGATVSYTVPDATDAVDGPVGLTCNPASGAQFALGKTTVTCTATDVAQNTRSKSFDVSVTDQSGPVVTVPDNRTVAATSTSGATVGFADDVSASDDVDGAITPTCTPQSGTTFGFGSTTVTCSATDKAGNISSKSFTVTVQDKTAPVVATPTPAPVEATGPDGAKVTWSGVSATDDTDGDVSSTLGCDPASGGIFPLGPTTVVCTAHDTHGNQGSGSFVVTVQDTTAPAITVPKVVVTVEADSSTGVVVDFADQVSAVDVVDGATDVTCTPGSGSAFALDATTPVSCTSTDHAGNTATASFGVHVVDTTAPVMPVLTTVIEEATGPTGAKVDYSVGAATDIVDGQVSVVCAPASGTVFALGDTTVHCTATDNHENAAHGSFKVTVQDTAPPTIDPVSLNTTEATGPNGADVQFTVTAKDVADPDPTVICDHQSGDTFPIGSTDVTCTATDASGNHSDYTFTVNVSDTTGPAVATVASTTLEATGPNGAPYDYSPPTATDTVDGDVSDTVACDPGPNSTFPLGKTSGACTAQDKTGNEGESKFTVTVQDTTAPVIPDLPNLTAVATSTAGASVLFSLPKAQDVVDGAVALDCNHASGSTFPITTTTVTCTATDTHGNTSSKAFTVTVGLSWSGYMAPVVSGGVYKQGSTIPFKFQLTGASAGITNLDARIWVRATNASANAVPATSTSTTTASDGNRFRWSSSDGQYIFNLSTKPLQAGTYDVIVDLGDGVQRTVRITLR